MSQFVKDRAKIAEAIIVLRRRADLKQKDLAVAAKVSPAHMSRIERGKVEAKHSTLKRIASALGFTLADLESFIDELAKSRGPDPAVEQPYPTYESSQTSRPAEELKEEERRMRYFLDLDD